jgi:putative FmdB family regulatory protein
MPLYEYQCDACGRRFEVIQKFSDSPADICRHCGKGPVHKLMSSPAIQFKGSGFYINDYAQKGKSDSSSTAAANKSGDSAKSEGSSATASDSSGSAKSDSTTTDGAKSDTAATPSKPASGSSKESKE